LQWPQTTRSGRLRARQKDSWHAPDFIRRTCESGELEYGEPWAYESRIDDKSLPRAWRENPSLLRSLAYTSFSDFVLSASNMLDLPVEVRRQLREPCAALVGVEDHFPVSWVKHLHHQWRELPMSAIRKSGVFGRLSAAVARQAIAADGDSRRLSILINYVYLLLGATRVSFEDFSQHLDTEAKRNASRIARKIGMTSRRSKARMSEKIDRAMNDAAVAVVDYNAPLTLGKVGYVLRAYSEGSSDIAPEEIALAMAATGRIGELPTEADKKALADACPEPVRASDGPERKVARTAPSALEQPDLFD
jgi:hypothetical protein